MVFRPSLDVGVADGFYDLIDGLVGDVYKQASKISRLAVHSGQEHYQVHDWATIGQSWAWCLGIGCNTCVNRTMM